MLSKPFRSVAFLGLTTFFLMEGAPLLQAAAFRDTGGTIYEDAVMYLADRGIVSGYPDATMRSNNPLKRSEALKVLLLAKGGYDDRLAWYGAHMPSMPLFSDLDQRAWYGPYVEVAFQDGIVSGYPNGTFRPAGILTVEEAVALLMRTYQKAGEADAASLSDYIENRSNQWYTGSINEAIQRNLLMHRGTLKLGQPVTRGQFFDMVYRMHVVESKRLTAFKDPEPEAPVARRATPVATQRTTMGPVAPSSDSDTGVTVMDGVSHTVSPIPQTAASIPTSTAIDHPYASEKHFAITMPSLGVTDLTISHPAEALTSEGILEPLKYGVGHLFGFPGGGGKIMVYGHSSGYAWDVSEYTKIFRRINELNVGDKVYVTYEGKLYIYEVTLEQAIAASDTAPFREDGNGEELILYTCWPPDSISQRYLIHATPVDTVAIQ